MPKLNAELKAELLATGTMDVDESLLVGTFTLIYSGRLRVSEVVKLKPEDIDTDRKMIRIKGGKGRKDRYTILSGIALDG